MEERERQSVKPNSKEAASPSTSRKPQLGENILDDGTTELNVCSENFNPLLALYSPTVPQLPFPNIKCFNNVAEYESFLKGGRGRAKPENVEKRRRKAMKGVADPERIERLKKLMVKNPVSEEGESSGAAPRRRKQKAQKNVLTRMPLCKGSPLGELHRCVEERIRVRVHIRTFKGLRGVCSGFVVAFDKFWNMAMVDVDETYREPLLGEALYHEKALTISRLFEKLNLQDSPTCKEQRKRQKAEENPTERLPANPSAASESSSAPSADTDSGATETRPSQAVKSKQDKGDSSLGAREPRAPRRTYGAVQTRHINQLFIRGESVVLVNPQPLCA